MSSMFKPLSTLAYGSLPDQVGDLYLPPTAGLPAHCAPVVVLLHGGFWRMAYGRDHIAPLAPDLAQRGYAVWNLEYRRLGAGGGWPTTLEDVRAGVNHLAVLEAQGARIDLQRVTLVGHSAGGHLALWCAGRVQGAAQPHPGVTVAAAVGLAAVSDLAFAYELGCGRGAAADLLGGSPAARPERYRTASPAQRLPAGVPQLLIHGTRDADVPVDMSRRYAAAARAAGDTVTYVELEGAGHMELVDPASAAHERLCGWLTA